MAHRPFDLPLLSPPDTYTCRVSALVSPSRTAHLPVPRASSPSLDRYSYVSPEDAQTITPVPDPYAGARKPLGPRDPHALPKRAKLRDSRGDARWSEDWDVLASDAGYNSPILDGSALGAGAGARGHVKNQGSWQQNQRVGGGPGRPKGPRRPHMAARSNSGFSLDRTARLSIIQDADEEGSVGLGGPGPGPGPARDG